MVFLVLTEIQEALMPSFVEELVFSFEEDTFEVLDKLVHLLGEWVGIVTELFMTHLQDIMTCGNLVALRFIHFLNHVNKFAYLSRSRIQLLLLLVLLGQC